jgi:amino acid permease
VLSTIIGGGIVGIPYSMYHTGIPMGLLLNIVAALSCQYSCVLLLGAQQNVPIQTNSIFELGYIVKGKLTIYLYGFLLILFSFGLMLIYFIVFGEVAAGCIKSLFYPETDNFLTNKVCYILILGIGLFYPIAQKELKKITALSVILFVSIAIIIAFMIV